MHGYGNRFAFVESDAGVHCEWGLRGSQEAILFWCVTFYVTRIKNQQNSLNSAGLFILLYFHLQFSADFHSDISVTKRIRCDQMWQNYSTVLEFI